MHRLCHAKIVYHSLNNWSKALRLHHWPLHKSVNHARLGAALAVKAKWHRGCCSALCSVARLYFDLACHCALWHCGIVQTFNMQTRLEKWPMIPEFPMSHECYATQRDSVLKELIIPHAYPASHTQSLRFMEIGLGGRIS